MFFAFHTLSKSHKVEGICLYQSRCLVDSSIMIPRYVVKLKTTLDSKQAISQINTSRLNICFFDCLYTAGITWLVTSLVPIYLYKTVIQIACFMFYLGFIYLISLTAVGKFYFRMTVAKSGKHKTDKPSLSRCAVILIARAKDKLRCTW